MIQLGIRTLASKMWGYLLFFGLKLVQVAELLLVWLNSKLPHGAMGRRIDPSWGGPIELFLVPASAPRLV